MPKIIAFVCSLAGYVNRRPGAGRPTIDLDELNDRILNSFLNVYNAFNVIMIGNDNCDTKFTWWVGMWGGVLGFGVYASILILALSSLPPTVI
jgi:hypothetical protein